MSTRLIAALLVSAAMLSAQVKLAPIDEPGFQKLLSQNRGKVVLVDFWATWCKPCRVETPQLVALASKLRSKGFELVTVSADFPEQEAAAQKFIAGMNVTGTAYIRKAKDDDAFINAVDQDWNGALPAMFLYDKRGRKVKSFVGETPVKDVEAAISKLL